MYFCLLEVEKERIKRVFFYFYHWLSFLLPCGIHVFPVASSPSLIMSLSVTLPSLLLPLFLCVSCPSGLVVLFFCRSSGHKAKESPRLPSIYKAFCHVNKDKLFPKFQHHCPPFTWRLIRSVSFARLICVYMSVCASMCIRALCGRACRKPHFLPGIIDSTNCRPCFILRKWQEQSGETEPGD